MSSATGQHHSGHGEHSSGITRKWWFWVIAGVVGLGVVALVFAPVIASSTMVRGMVVDTLDEVCQGKFEIADIAIGWGGPTRVKGFKVFDTVGREVLSANVASVEPGMWGLATDWQRLGKVKVESASVELIVGEDGTISLIEALMPVTPSDEPLPEVRTVVTLTDASVRLTMPNGQTYTLPKIDGEVTLDTLSKIAAKIDAQLEGGGTLSLDVELAGLVTDGRISPLGATLSLRELKTTDDVDLGPISRLLTGEPTFEGRARADLTGTASPGGINLRLNVDLIRFRAAALAAQNVAPLSMNLKGSVMLDERLVADLALTGEPGTMSAEVTVPMTDNRFTVTREQLVSALFKGETDTLPDFTLKSGGKLSLAALAKTFPEWVRLDKVGALGEGHVEVQNVIVRGGRTPSATGGVTLEKTGTGEGPLRFALTFDAGILPGKGLVVRGSTLDSAHLTASAKGDLKQFTASYDSSDLAALHADLNEIFNLAAIQLAGKISGNLSAERIDEDHVAFKVDTSGDAFTFSQDVPATSAGATARKVAATRASIMTSGNITLADGVPESLSFDATTLDATALDYREGARHLTLATASVRTTAQVDLDKSALRKATFGDTTLKASGLDYREDARTLALSSCGLSTPTASVDFEKGALAGASFGKTHLDAAGLNYREADKRLAWSSVAVDGTGTVAFVGGSLSKATLGKTTLTLGQDLIAECTGTYNAATGALAGDADITRAQLKPLVTALKGFTGPVAELDRWDGLAVGKVKIARASEGKPWTLDAGSLTITDPTLDDKPIGIASAAARWTDVTLGADFTSANAKNALVITPVATLQANDFKASWGKAFSLEGKASVNADVAQTMPVVARVLGRNDLPKLPAAKIDWTGAFTRTEESIAFSGKGTLKDLVIDTDGGKRRVDSAATTQEGIVRLADGKPSRVVLTRNDINVPGMLVGTATGWYDLNANTLSADVDVTQTDLAAAGDWLAAFGMPYLKRYAGAATVKTNLTRTSADSPIVSKSGVVVLKNPVLDGKPLIGRDVKIDWRDVSLDPRTKALAATWVMVDGGEVASGSLSGVKGNLGEKFFMNGQADLAANLPLTLPAVARIVGWENVPKFRSGIVRWQPEFSSDGTTTRVAGRKDPKTGQPMLGTITNLQIGDPPKAFTEPKATFDLIAEINPGQEAMAVKKLSVTSTPLSPNCTGTVTQYRSLVQLHQIKGTYTGDWDRIMPLARQFVPALEGTVSISGPTSGTFVLAGPLNHPQGKPPYRFLTGEAQAGWTSAVIYDIPLGKASFDAKLKDSQLVLPLTQVPAGRGLKGMVNLAGRVDMTVDPPVLIIEKLKPVDGLAITKDFKWERMSRFFPFFGSLAGVTGTVSVNLDDLRYPLSEAGLNQMTGKGSVELIDMKVSPGGMLGIMGTILKLYDVTGGNAEEIPVTVAPFNIKNGRVYYDNFKLLFGNKYDMIFSGSVGFDRTLDMQASLPGGLSLFRGLKAPGVLGDATKSRAVVHITGTTDAPRINLLKTLLPTDVGKGLIEGILDRNKDKKDATPPEDGKKEEKPKSPLDILLNRDK